jgi:hypothetical protein
MYVYASHCGHANKLDTLEEWKRVFGFLAKHEDMHMRRISVLYAGGGPGLSVLLNT